MPESAITSGAFVTVEGGDGAGKTTQMSYVESLLSSQGASVLRTREPGGTEMGEAIRKLLLDQQDLSISEMTELMLIFAARRQHLDEVIKPALSRGEWVLCDRFTDATYAYQGGGRGIDRSKIAVLENWVQEGLKPDLTLVLDVPVDLGQKRTLDRGNIADRFERQPESFKESVRLTYLQMAEAEPDRIRVVDASQSVEHIQTELDLIIEAFFRRFGLPDDSVFSRFK